MGQKKLLLLVIFFLFVLAGLFYVTVTNTTKNTQIKVFPAVTSSPLPTIKINETLISVEIANTPEKTRSGLSGRSKESFPDNQGMLFMFSQKGIPLFWMIDMKFPLDMIWISDNVVVDITDNIPFPEENTPSSELPRYRPSYPVNMVLEVNAGFAERSGIEVGDRVEINFNI